MPEGALCILPISCILELILLSSGSLLSAIVGLAACIMTAKKKEDGMFALGILLLVNAVLLFFAAWQIRGRKGSRKNMIYTRGQFASLLIIAGWACLFFMLWVRLFSFSHFGGSWYDMNFGLKAGSTQDNIAFTMEPESFGHFSQGLLACFLLPETDLLFAAAFRSQHPQQQNPKFYRIATTAKIASGFILASKLEIQDTSVVLPN
jgi:hypothetical protein